MKLFLDSADESAIKKGLETGLIDGITTNPSNLSAVTQNPQVTIQKLCSLLHNREISIETTKKEPSEVYRQAQQITDLGPHVLVKIPCHMAYTEIIKKLVSEGRKVNVTLVFSLAQGLLMSKLGVHYISPFVGRLEDNGQDGTLLVKQLVDMVNHYQFKTRILAASIRTQKQFEGIINAKAHVATISPSLFDQLMTHQLTTKGIAQFDTDWEKLLATNSLKTVTIKQITKF